jgi:hypothetical protein
MMGPLLDRYISNSWVMNYDWNVPALSFLALSCACAVGVNVSQFMCLGRFSAVSYQVCVCVCCTRMCCACCIAAVFTSVQAHVRAMSLCKMDGFHELSGFLGGCPGLSKAVCVHLSSHAVLAHVWCAMLAGVLQQYK